MKILELLEEHKQNLEEGMFNKIVQYKMDKMRAATHRDPTVQQAIDEIKKDGAYWSAVARKIEELRDKNGGKDPSVEDAVRAMVNTPTKFYVLINGRIWTRLVGRRRIPVSFGPKAIDDVVKSLADRDGYIRTKNSRGETVVVPRNGARAISKEELPKYWTPKQKKESSENLEEEIKWNRIFNTARAYLNDLRVFILNVPESQIRAIAKDKADAFRRVFIDLERGNQDDPVIKEMMPKLNPYIAKIATTMESVENLRSLQRVIYAASDWLEQVEKIEEYYRKKHRQQQQDDDLKESEEIHSYKRLDGILNKLYDLVKKRQDRDSEKYGSVGACVLDPDNRIIAATSSLKEGKWVHAEKNAIDKYQEQYGSIPEDSIIITTCSPCSEAMDDRFGSSCTDVINNSGIKKVYAGFMDPTQSEEQREFNIMETADSDIRQKCKELASEFLDLDNLNENFADGKVKGKSRPGRVKRAGASCSGSVSELRARAKKYSGERAKMYHWCANMKSGRSKKKK